MVDKAVPDNPGEDEFAQLARKACLIVGRLHDAVHELIDNEIEKAGLPALPDDAPDEINEAILELVSDLIYALPQNQKSCLTEGLPQIVELWRKSQKIKLAPGLSRAHFRVVGRSPILPRLDAATTEAPAPQSTPPRLEAGRRVLVIDDLPDVAQSLAFLLKVLGTEVRIAHSGAEGLQICAEFEPELVFVDLSMPEMDGFETARRIRESSAGRRAKLVALTAFGEALRRTQMQEAGFAGHLSKPARLSQLEKLLASVSAEMA
jgi:CheY-like chemotaxis protein